MGVGIDSVEIEALEDRCIAGEVHSGTEAAHFGIAQEARFGIAVARFGTAVADHSEIGEAHFEIVVVVHFGTVVAHLQIVEADHSEIGEVARFGN